MKRVLAIGDPSALVEAPPMRAAGSEPTFDFDPARALVVLEGMKAAGDGPVALAGEDWAQGAMGALVQAEFLAAQAGVVPWFTLPTGEQGVLTVGAAREKIDDAPEDVRTIYLATHGLVRSTHAQAKPWDGNTPLLSTLPSNSELGSPAVIIAVTVVAIAAIIGTAWYLTSRSTIEVEGRNARTTAVASEVAGLAREQLARKGEIDAGVWEVFKAVADAEAGRPVLVPLVLGLAAVGVGGAIAWKRWQQQRAGRR
jgi:hypothetical protein